MRWLPREGRGLTVATYGNAKARPAAEKDVQLRGRSCDTCGELDLDEEPVRLEGPAGDVVLCRQCVTRLAPCPYRRRLRRPMT